jgi:hypothetical protein
MRTMRERFTYILPRCWTSNVFLIVSVGLLGSACGKSETAAADGGIVAVAMAGRSGAGTGGGSGRAPGVSGSGGTGGSEPSEDAGVEPDAGRADGGAGTAGMASAGKKAPPPTGGMSGSPAQPSGLTERNSARVLLSGHSLTDNPIGDYLEQLAEQRARDYGWEQQIVIGSPLRFRTRGESSSDESFSGYSLGKNREGNEKNILQELASPTAIGASENYDTLIVTERHDIMDVIQWEDTVPLLRHYHDRLREHESAVRTLFYQSWPDIDRSNPQEWIAYQTEELAAWECAASKVNLSLQRDSAPQAVSVLPVAVALAKFVERVLAGTVPGATGLDAVFTDDVHVTELGAYVAAAAAYSATFQVSPVGATPPSGIEAGAATVALEVAWDVVSKYLGAGSGQWNRTMEECRTRLRALCPKYRSIRDDTSDCSVWQQADGPMSWPDTSFPLPAP